MSGTTSETPNTGRSPNASSSLSSVRISADEEELSEEKEHEGRKNVTKACESCKRAKTKCDGHQPCERCTTRMLTCNYTTEVDGRTRNTRRRVDDLKRRVDDLKRENELFNSLLATIRSSNDTQLSQIVSMIRANASLEDINARLVLAKHELHTSQRRTVFRVDRLIDVPIYTVPATPWTTVTDDIHLVSHLFSLWATWENIFPDGVVLDYILRDMQAAQLECHFCSPFLANCIFAAACVHSDYDETKSRNGKQSSLLDEFIDEAKQYLRQEAEPSITKLQGLGVLFLILTKTNRDREGWDIATEATNQCAELLRLGQREKLLKMAKSREEEVELAHALDVAIWGVFSATTAFFMLLQRPQLSIDPPRPFPEVPSSLRRDRCWIPYHGHDGRVPLHLWETLKLHGFLASLTREATLVLFLDTESTPDHSRALIDLERRLTAGYQDIPEYIKESPAACYLRCWWLSVILTVVLRKQDTKGAEIMLSRVLEIVEEIVAICRFTRTIVDRDKFMLYLCHPIYQALLVLTDSNGHNTYDDDITELLLTLRAISQRTPWAVALLRMIQLDAGRRKLTLPDNVHKLFADFERDDIAEWKNELQTSRYPYLDSFSFRGKAVNGALSPPAEMGGFLDAFDDLSLETKQKTDRHKTQQHFR